MLWRPRVSPSGADGRPFEAAADVIARAVAQVADLDEVTGDERVRLADVPALLRDLAPAWGAYRTLTGVQLRELLDEAGVRTTNVGNVPRLDPADLRRALGERSELGDNRLSRTYRRSPARPLA